MAINTGNILTPGNATTVLAAQQVLKGANPQRAIGQAANALGAGRTAQNIGQIGYASGAQQAAANGLGEAIPLAQSTGRRAAAQAAAQMAAQGTAGAAPIIAEAAPIAARVGQAAAPLGTAGAAALQAAPMTAADFAAAEAPTVAKTGVRGLLSRVPFAGGAAGEGAGAGILGEGGALAAGSIGRGLGYAGLGLLGGNLAQSVTGEQDGTWDDALQYGVTGAGIGAGIGSVVPVIGTGVGAVVGGLGGALWGALAGEDQSDDTKASKALAGATDKATGYLNAVGVSGADQTKILAQLQYQAAGLNPDDTKALYQQMLPQYAQGALAIAKQDKLTADDLATRASRSAAIQQYLLPQLQAQMAYTNQAAQAYGDQAGNQSIPYWQAQSNNAYLAQIAALTAMSGGSVRSQAATPDLNDYLAQYLTTDQLAGQAAQQAGAQPLLGS